LGHVIPIFPLQVPLLPRTDLGVHVFEPHYKTLIAHALANGQTFGVVLIRPATRRSGGVKLPADGYDVGTLAQIGGYARLPDGRYLLEVEGTKRFRIVSGGQNGSYPTAEVAWLNEPIGNFSAARAASMDVAKLFRLYRARKGDGDLPVHLPVDPVSRSYVIASLMRIDPAEKQQLLEMASAEERLGAERSILLRENTLLDHLRMRR
jgi:hypothetical protein